MFACKFVLVTLRAQHTLIFLKCIVNEHIFKNLVSFGKNSSSLILRLGNVVCVLKLEPRALIRTIDVIYLYGRVEIMWVDHVMSINVCVMFI